MEQGTERKHLEILERIANALEKIVDQHLIGFSQEELDKLITDYDLVDRCQTCQK